MNLTQKLSSKIGFKTAIALLVGTGLISAACASGVPNAIITYIAPDCSVTIYQYSAFTNILYNVPVGTLISNYDQCRVILVGTNALKTNTFVGATLHHALDGTNSNYGTNWNILIPAQNRTSGVKTITVTSTNIAVN